MIKLITLITKFIIAALMALLFSSCVHSTIHFGDGIKGSGNITTKTRAANQDFKRIEVSHGIKVIVTQANNKSITVEADDNIQQHIITKIENGLLKIEADESYNATETPVVRVQLPVINGLRTDSGSEITSAGVLITENINVKSSSGSEINIEIEADAIKIESESGSNTSVYPIVKLEAKASSGSSINYHKVPKTLSKEENSGGSVSGE